MRTGRDGIMLFAGALLFVMLFSFSLHAENYTPSGQPEQSLVLPTATPGNLSSASAFTGRLRLYVIEPSSRWRSDNEEYGMPYYHNAVIDYAFDQDITVQDGSTYERTVVWDASLAGWGDVQESNIAVVAVVFNSEYTIKYAEPPSGKPFFCYAADAAAAARPGESSANVAVDGFTHTVFAEEATQTYCTYCPLTLFAMDSIDESGDYPFCYVTLVDDKSSIAYSRCRSDFNIGGFPTTFFDGGDNLVFGGYPGQAIYREKIEACGTREVTGLILNLDVEWTGPDIVTAHVTIDIGDPINQAPVCTGPPICPDTTLTALTYTLTADAIDPEGEEIYYKWDCGDEVSDWIGPYESGEQCEYEHSWSAAGAYTVKVKSKDKWGEESAWSPGKTVFAFYCGDTDGVNMIDLDDVIYLIAYIFTGGPQPRPLETGDTDCVNEIDLDDVIYLIAYVFTGGPAPCSGCL